MSDYPDYQTLRDEVNDLRRSVQILERGERFENLERLIEANTAAIQTIASSTQHLLSEQNRKIEALETNLRGDMDKLETSLRSDISTLRGDMSKLDEKIEMFRSDLENKINHSQTVILGAIGAVGVVLVVVQFLVSRG